jgi:hypothetical protein
MKDRGTWFCVTCGELSEQRRVLGVPFPASGAELDSEVACAEVYAAWIERHVPEEDGHAWIGTGCHYQGNRIACGPTVNDYAVFAGLPRAPDSPRVRDLAVRLTRAEKDELYALLGDAQRAEPDELFPRLAHGAPMSVPEFERALDAWYERHPAWR